MANQQGLAKEKLSYWLFAIIGLLMLMSFKASAQTVEKDWSFQKVMDGTLGTSSCVASTAVAKSDLPVKLELIFPENDDKAAIILIHAKNLQGQVKKAYLRPDAKTLYTSALFSSDAVTGEDVYLLSALQIPEALQVIAANATLDVYFGEGATAKLARFSLRGSSVTLNRAADCRASKQLLNKAFSDLIRKDAALAPAIAGSPADFLASYEGTLALINQRIPLLQALASVQQQQNLLANQVRIAQNADTRAAQAEQDAIQNSSNLKQRIIMIQQRMASAQQNLPQLQAEQPQAAAAVDRAAQLVSSIQAQISRLQYDIDQAIQQQQFKQNIVLTVQAQINDIQNRIQDLRNQMQQLVSEQNQQREQINQLQSQINNLNNRIAQFNASAEAQRILANSAAYQQAKNELQRWQQIQQAGPGQLAEIQGRIQKALEVLNHCQNQKPTPPATAPNCSAQQEHLSKLQAEHQQKQSQIAEAGNKISQAQQQISSLEREAQQKANQMREGLIADRNNLMTQQQRDQNHISELQQRINQIQQSNLPQQQQALNQRQAELYNARAALNAAIDQVNMAQSRLVQYKISVGYDQAVANLASAQNTLASLNSQIASAIDWLQNGPARLEKTKQDLVDNETSLPAYHSATLQADQALAQAQGALAAQQPDVDKAQALVDQMSASIETSRQTTQGLAKSVF